MCVLPLPKHWVLTFALIGCAVVTQRVCDTEIQGLSQYACKNESTYDTESVASVIANETCHVVSAWCDRRTQGCQLLCINLPWNVPSLFVRRFFFRSVVCRRTSQFVFIGISSVLFPIGRLPCLSGKPPISWGYNRYLSSYHLLRSNNSPWQLFLDPCTVLQVNTSLPNRTNTPTRAAFESFYNWKQWL